MLVVRVVLAVAFSFVAIAFAQRKRARNCSSVEPAEEEISDGKEIYTYADAGARSKEKEEEAKCASSCSPALNGKSYQENEQLLLPEFDDLLNGVLNFPSDSEKSKMAYDSDDSVESKQHQSNAEDDEALEMLEALAEFDRQKPEDDGSSVELVQLRALVADLKQKEIQLEAQLLEYYGLKEQENNYLELEHRFKLKNTEIERLKAKLASIQDQARSLAEELEAKQSIMEELEFARSKIKELEKNRQLDKSHTKAQLFTLKQQVAIFEERERETSKQNVDTEQKLQTLAELEVEVMELRRTMKDLQHQKRDMTVKLSVTETKLTELSNRTESEKVAEMQAQASALRQANEDLSKQVEGLQMNRFSEVEELVYLRWVNACLRYELRNLQAPPGKLTALDLGKSFSPKSQENAKQLMIEYAGSDFLAPRSRELSEQEYDSISSFPSTPSEGDLDDSSFDGHLARHSSNKKLGFLKKLKRWGRNKEGNSVSPALSSSNSRSLANPGHRRSRSKGSLESLIRRNTSDSLAITTFGTNDFDVGVGFISTDTIEPFGEPQLIRSRSTSDANVVSCNVATSFDVVSKFASGVVEGKYPAFKDKHQLAISREKALKEKAEQARAEKLVEKLRPAGAPSTKSDGTAPGLLNPDVFLQLGRDVNLTTEHPVRVAVSKRKLCEVQKRAPRIPKPAPKSSKKRCSPDTAPASLSGVAAGPPLPPPTHQHTRAPSAQPPLPPPPGQVKQRKTGRAEVQRVPEVVEFYQSLMKREAKKNAVLGYAGLDINSSDAHNSMIGEIEDRSAFLLAVKADVETQGDFVLSLASEVREAAYSDIEDVIAFVAWLDDELSFLVDERAVLKHFDWPETKADALREAAFEYQDLKKLENEVGSFEDNEGLSCELSLKKMLVLLEKVEQNVYALLRTRDMAIARYKEFNIPTEWMLDSGLVGKIKLETIRLARKYMKRVASEHDSSSSVKEPHREFLLLQGVRFAFRVHQFAGGFDAESMHTFEELRNRVYVQTLG